MSERAGHSSFSLAGQVALVTGAGSPGGIGFASSQLLAERRQAAQRAHGRPDGLALCAGLTGASVMLDFGLARGY